MRRFCTSAAYAALFMLSSIAAVAQKVRLPKINTNAPRTTFACNFFDNGTTYTPPAVSGVSDAQAEMWMRGMINKISAITGLQNRFFLRAMKDYNNCSAICFGNDIGQDRYIQFDRDFLESYQKQTGDKWFAFGVVAHEIGHHLNGHSLDGIGSRQEKEIEADEFAGFVMRKAGATLAEAQNIFSFMNETEGPPTHPVKKKRYEAIKRGWDKAAGIVSYETLSFNDADTKDFAVRNLDKARNTTDPNEKLKYINMALKQVPAYAEALSEKGMAYLQQSKLDSAYKYTLAALDLEPEIGLLYLNLGKVLYYDNEPDKSKEALNLALYYNPLFPEAYMFMAQAAFEKKDFKDALLQNEIALRMAPQRISLRADILAGMAIANYNLGNYKEALEDMERAKKLDPDNFRVRMLYDTYKQKAS